MFSGPCRVALSQLWERCCRGLDLFFRAMSTFPSYARVPMAMVATGIGILCYTSVTEYQHHRVKISTSDHVLPADYSLLFRAQRNMYLTGLTLCLMFIIWRLPSFFKAYIESTEIEHPKPKPTSTQSNTPPTNTNKQKKAE